MSSSPAVSLHISPAQDHDTLDNSPHMIAFKDPKLPLCLLAMVYSLRAQEPAFNRRGPRGEAAAIAGAKEDPAAVARGTKLYAAQCAGCHGKTARGNPGAPDLIR